MKNILLLMIFLTPFIMKAQSVNNKKPQVDTAETLTEKVVDLNSIKIEEPKIHDFVEQMPEFPGGDGALIKFVKDSLRYPEKEKNEEISGKVIVKFVIDERGKVSDPKVVRGVSPGLDAEAIRIIKLLPNFTSGRIQGKPVKCYYNLPIVFRLP